MMLGFGGAGGVSPPMQGASSSTAVGEEDDGWMKKMNWKEHEEMEEEKIKVALAEALLKGLMEETVHVVSEVLLFGSGGRDSMHS